MPPAYLLSCKAADGGVAVPDYLGAYDHPWLRALIDEYQRFVGRRRRELTTRLKEPVSCAGPRHKQLLAMHVLDRLSNDQRPATIAPRQVRAAVFGAAAQATRATSEVFASVAAELGLPSGEVERALLADIPAERRVSELEPCTPIDLALRCNLALAQGLIKRSAEVRIKLRGNAHAVVRSARLRGLICVATRDAANPLDTHLALSGPLALFRRTNLYGRALASLIPTLSWCDAFRVNARATIDGGAVHIQLASGDPIFPGREPRRFDSQLERHFVRDFGRAAPDWQIIREPTAVATPTGLIFPDFALRHLRDTRRTWLLEIVGFWTPAYLEHKLRTLRSARIDNLILCIDETRNCSAHDVPRGARIVGFRKRVDARRVLAIVDA